jgi:uncharacterized protein YjbI with pentapeptide repeats
MSPNFRRTPETFKHNIKKLLNHRLIDAPLEPEADKQGTLHSIADWLDSWHIARIFQSLGSFLLCLTLIGFYLDHESRLAENASRAEEREARHEDRIVAGWQLLSIKSPGNSGKIEALEFLHKEQKPLIGIDLSVKKGQPGAYLVKVQLPEANLAKANLTNADLTNAYLKNSDLKFSILNNADLTDADLSGAALQHSSLTNANLIDSNLSNANLFNASLIKANLNIANLSMANLTSSNLTNADLTNADLTDADLANANLTGANLSGVDFSRVNLIATNLTNVDLTFVFNLNCAQLTKAKAWEKTYRSPELACGSAPYDKKLF